MMAAHARLRGDRRVDRPCRVVPLSIQQQKMVAANMGLVGYFAAPYLQQGSTFEELSSAGFLGLCEAVQHYDPSIGAFSTYARHWIRRAILEEIWARRLIRLPKSRPVGREGEQWDRMRDVTVAGFEGRDGVRIDPPDTHGRSPHEDERIPAVREAIRALPRRHREVLERRLGGETHREIGFDLGVTRSACCKIERKARAFIRRRLAAHGV